MPPEAGSNDWAATVDAIAQRAPKFVLERESLSAQVRLLGLLGSAAPLNELLDGLATCVETWAEGLKCSVLLVDPSGRMLRPGAAPSLPAAYIQAIDPVPIAIGEGSCGTAAARREMVIVEDVERSDLWTQYAPTAVAHGLRACWSVPILDEERKILGTLAMYYAVPRKPSTQEVDLIQFAAALAAFVIQRHRDTERLRTSEARLDAAVWGTGIGLWEYTDGGEFQWFDAWCERVDLDPCIGYDSLEQWYGRMHPDDVERYMRADEPCQRAGVDHYSVEYRVRTQKDRWHWVHERGRVTARASDGIPTRWVGVCIDIEQQKTTEAALRKAEDRYELAINAARLPTWEYDVASDTRRGNLHWHRAVGYDMSEEVTRERTETWLSDVHPDDAQQHEHIFKELSADRTGFYENEVRIKQPNGHYKWLLDRARVVERSATGTPLKVVGVSIDIDARKRMESALRESEERFRSAFEFAAIGMALVAPDGRWLRVNRALCRIIGYSADELRKIDFQTITHPDDLDADMGFVRKMLDGTLSYYEMEKRYVHKAGQTIWILLSASLVRDDEGRPHYFISQIQDITARKKAEEGLRESELRYRTTSDLVLGFVFEGAVTGGVPQPIWVSHGFERVFGCSLEDFNRLGIRHFYDAETRAQLRAAATVVVRGEELRMDVRLRSADGTRKWLRVFAKTISTNSGGERILGVAEDISEEIRLAHALREATQHEQQRLGQEIHDGLGQELTGLAYLASSLAKAASGSDSTHANDLAALEKIANQAIQTCRNIARGVSPLTESRGSLVQALRHLVEGVAASGRMRIDFEAIENAPLALPWAYRDHLYRIAQEAITNALRHSEGDRMEVTIQVDPAQVRIEIADNGRGFDPHRRIPEGLGIDSMRQRAAAIGASLHLIAPYAGAMVVRCECPQVLPIGDELISSATGAEPGPNGR